MLSSLKRNVKVKYWATEIIATDPQTMETKLWAGPVVPGVDRRDAEEYCRFYGLGYCKVIGVAKGEMGYIFDRAQFN